MIAKPLSSRSVTVAPLVIVTDPKSFPLLLSVALFAAPGATVTAPVATTAPVRLIAPFVVMLRFFPAPSVIPPAPLNVELLVTPRFPA